MISRKMVLNVVSLAVVPFVVLTFYLLFSRWPQRVFTEISDQIAFVSSVVFGCVFLLCLPINKWIRVIATVLYVPLMTSAVFWYTLYFVCYFFGDCI